MRWKHMAAMLLAVAGTASPTLAKGPDPLQVRIDTGTLAGTPDGDTLAFRGIPYAAPPVGPLRWRPPAAPQPWTGVRDASHYGAACPQTTEHKEPWAQVGPQSEDCLFLNVWRPKKAGKYPVMLFVHGGSFTYGAAGVPLYEGAHLAERGAVIVTINYRLGRLGFFAHPALSAEDPNAELGNYGIMDAVAALRWVKRNIAKFGGDPANVTLFGESAGAGTTQLLMATPSARGLFHRAISESGAGGNSLVPLRGTPASGESLGVQFAESLKLKDATAEQLRALPVEKLLGRAFPFIDGKVVVMSPGDAFRLNKAARIPLIMGANSNEGSLIGQNAGIAKPLLGAAYPELLSAYAARPGIPPSAAALDLAEDFLSNMPSLSVAVMHAANGNKAYDFYFDQVRSDERKGTLGAQHGGEVEFLFGNLPAGQVWDADDRRVSKLMGDYWVNFARTGNPNSKGAPLWPAVKTAPFDYMIIAANTHAAKLSPTQERVREMALDMATKLWKAEPK